MKDSRMNLIANKLSSAHCLSIQKDSNWRYILCRIVREIALTSFYEWRPNTEEAQNLTGRFV